MLTIKTEKGLGEETALIITREDFTNKYIEIIIGEDINITKYEKIHHKWEITEDITMTII